MKRKFIFPDSPGWAGIGTTENPSSEYRHNEGQASSPGFFYFSEALWLSFPSWTCYLLSSS